MTVINNGWRLAALAAALWLAPVQAQDEPAPAGDAPSADAPAAPAPAAEPSEESVEQRLEEAFKREFAFLVEQKAQLERSLQDFRTRASREVGQVKSRVDQLQSQLVAVQDRQNQAREELKLIQERTRSTSNAQQVLEGTFSQAESTLADYGIDKLGGDDFAELGDDEKVRETFATARELIAERSEMRTSDGAFFTQDGSRIDGQLIKVGGIAAYGVSPDAAGVLAPAGGGRYKIWENAATDTVREIAQGASPAVLPLFLYESLDTSAEGTGAESVIEHIESGGTIAWIIMGLAGVALLLILVRIAFLARASSRTGKLEREIGALVRDGRMDDAREACSRFKGSAARVVGSALRNMDRQREHLEDIISESILAESGHLNRFGAMILVIAAVSPLLGLLGTVTGMISTFDVITKFGTGDPKLLSGGISTALVTTELGLMVAIPTLLIGNVLSSWAERIKDSMEKAALRVTNLYHAGRDGTSPRMAHAGSPA